MRVALGFAGGLLVLALYLSAFVIQEGRQAVITQFGKPVRTVQEAGLHFKLPVLQDVRRLDGRILNWDGFPNQIPTRDKKYIEVDTTARWRIKDALKFIQTVQNERGARSRLDAILDGITRDVISSHNLVEAVRNSNAIFDAIKEMEERASQASEKEMVAEQEEIIGDVGEIEIGRERLSSMIIERAQDELKELGIELIDVQLRRISYEESVEKKVYSRMISERERIAEKIRSVGKGEKRKIEGKIQKELQKIKSQAYRTVQEVKGKAEAESTEIYARAYSKSPKFFELKRRLEAYEKVFEKGSVQMLLSTDSEFWKLLKGGPQN